MIDDNKLVKMLEMKGIEFEEGLTDKEIAYIEKIYSITFPKQLKDFIKIKLPVSNGFYNWRDFTEANIEKIKSVINAPMEGLLFDIEYNGFWVENWGGEVDNNIETRKSVFLEKYYKAPKLIPIYGHRYMPDINAKNIPILSVMQSDIIIYGENLEDYFKREFILSNKPQLDNYKYDIEFWSDIINYY